MRLYLHLQSQVANKERVWTTRFCWRPRACIGEVRGGDLSARSGARDRHAAGESRSCTSRAGRGTSATGHCYELRVVVETTRPESVPRPVLATLFCVKEAGHR